VNWYTYKQPCFGGRIFIYISDVYANTLNTKPNIQPVYPEIPIIPIVNNISPEPSIAVIQINPT